MLELLRKLFSSSGPDTDSTSKPAPGVHTHDVRLAACVLLVELANADGEFSAPERQRITEILVRHFDMDQAGAEGLIAEAAAASRRTADDFTFTRQIVRDYDLNQRRMLAEMMWQVVLADGTVASDESWLMRKFGNLLQLDAAFLSETRKRLEEGMRG